MTEITKKNCYIGDLIFNSRTFTLDKFGYLFVFCPLKTFQKLGSLNRKRYR